MQNIKSSTKLILLSPNDNIYIVSQDIAAGEILLIDGDKISLSVNISMGHKIARQQINKGQKIIKYGFPIGVAAMTIKKGTHAHVHNIQSSYTKTHGLDQTSDGFGNYNIKGDN